MSAVKQPQQGLYTIEEYFKFEDQTQEKYEFHNGKVVAMAGGSLPHGIIGSNTLIAVNDALRTTNKKCITLNSDVKIYIETTNHFVYSDGMVICGEIETHEKEKNGVINPILIIEVLSDSTSGYDRGEKFHKYCSLPSFKEYVLIDQSQPVIDTLYRGEEKYWRMVTTIGLDKSIRLHSIECEISMVSIYQNVSGLKPPQITLDF